MNTRIPLAAVAWALTLPALADNAPSTPVEFHVKPGGVEPFSTQNPAVRPDLDNPREPIWSRGGIKAQFWISEGGSAEKPFSTLFQAQLAVRELLRQKVMAKQPAPPIKVIVHDGVYRMEDTLDFLPEDSGTPENPIIYEAAPGAKPVLSGGTKISGWQNADGEIPGLPAAAKGHVWVAPAPEVGADTLDFRQIYINGAKGVRARTPNAENHADPQAAHFNRLVDWDIANRRVVVPAAAVAPWRNLKRVEMALQQSWELSYLRFDSVKIDGDKAYITFQEPERIMVFARPYPWPRKNDPYHFVNAVEFLDTPGEWYLDRKEAKLYYWPRSGEDMHTAEVVAPRLENVVRLTGTLERPVHDIHFKGISFADATWLRPSQKGHMAIQAGMFINRISYRIQGGIPEFPSLDNIAYCGRPPAGVYGAMCDHIRFEGCTFRNMASSGIDLHFGTHDNTVLGCTFDEIGGNGIQAGKFSDDGFEVHIPFNPKDSREFSQGEYFSNNLIRRCGTEDWGCCAIAAGYVTGVRIEHNELSDLPYSAISLGWGWNRLANCMRDNKVVGNHIHDYMKRLGDGGGIYCLSNQSPSEVSGNWIHDLRRSPVGDGGCMIYLDEGSSGMLVKNNLTESGAFNRNRNGPGNHWANNGPTGPPELRGGSSTTDGMIGKAIRSTYREFPHEAKLDPAQFTIEAWVRLQTQPKGRLFIASKNGNEWDNTNISVFLDDKRLAAYLNMGGGQGNCLEIAGAVGALPLNQWVQVAATYDGDMMRLYFGGREVGSRKIGKPRAPGSGALMLGARGDGFGTFDGDVDEVRLYDRALTAAEINANLKAVREGRPDAAVAAGLVRHWGLDEKTKLLPEAGLEPEFRKLLK